MVLTATLRSKREVSPWIAASSLEAIVAAFVMGRIAFGPISTSPSRTLWLLGTVAYLALYLGAALWTASPLRSQKHPNSGQAHLLSALATLPFLLLFLLLGLQIQFAPEQAQWLWDLMSPIQPFPAIAMATLLLFVWLLKLLIVACLPSHQEGARNRAFSSASDVAIPAALLLVGALQASVYLIPIGNAFLRFWAIADGVASGTPYPVTLTEEGPMSAGSPPYVYDLPLFPLMLQLSFALVGHNSAAAYIPPVVANMLFPLSLYLLIRESTNSRPTALLFSALASLFPYLRFWVLNLPDPDPLLLTSGCLAAFFYLRTWGAPENWRRWAIAGVAGGVLSLARPEGVLYAGFLTLGLMASRPRIKPLVLYLSALALFLVPMVAVWLSNFGFLWPQNYNRTLRLDYPIENYQILKTSGALTFYSRGLGLDEPQALALLVLFCLSVLFGAVAMAFKARRLLAYAIPGIGNTVAIFFANPYIPNTYHFADFFRHDSFGIPFMVATAAYGFHAIYSSLIARRQLKPLAYLCLALLVAAVIREGDILANPTLTHRPGATQALTTYTYLSLEDVLRNTMSLPAMSYYHDGTVTVARLTSMAWPDEALDFFAPLDISFDSQGRPFGYASVVASLVGLCFALLARNPLPRQEPPAPRLAQWTDTS
ncbi:MAG: glycosyltransferase family 39 protein [Chloroflexota bacterium]